MLFVGVLVPLVTAARLGGIFGCEPCSSEMASFSGTGECLGSQHSYAEMALQELGDVNLVDMTRR